MPVGVQAVNPGHQVGQRAGPGERPAEHRGAQQADAGQPGHVPHDVREAAGQRHAGPGRGQRAGRQPGEGDRGAQPQVGQPPAGRAFRLAERAAGRDRDDGGAGGLEDQRQLQRAVVVPVPVQRAPQSGGAGRQQDQGGRNAAAHGVQAHQAHRDRRHGSCASVTRPARSAARCAASQACRAAGDSAANRLAARLAGLPGSGSSWPYSGARSRLSTEGGNRDRARDDRELGLARARRRLRRPRRPG